MADKTYTIAEIRAYEAELNSQLSSGKLIGPIKLSDYIALTSKNEVVVASSTFDEVVIPASTTDEVVSSELKNEVVIPASTTDEVVSSEPKNEVVLHEVNNSNTKTHGRKSKSGEGLIEYCKDGLLISYKKDSKYIGKFNASENAIEYNGELFYTPSSFGSYCIEKIKPERTTKECSGWDKCYYLDEKGEWNQLKLLRKE